MKKETIVKKKKAVFNWSGGKDSAHALLKVLQSDEYDIVALLTTINRSTQLSTMHNIPLDLLQAQSNLIGIPLELAELKPGGNMEDYHTVMEKVVEKFKAKGVTHFIYGDIYLHDIRQYREQQLNPLGIEVVEPLWGKSSEEIIKDFLKTGLKTIVVTTMADGLGLKAIGQVIDNSFIASLPPSYDPNGENGEYHTFCFDGPIFKSSVSFSLGEPYTKSFDIRLENGNIQTFSYCFVQLISTEDNQNK